MSVQQKFEIWGGGCFREGEEKMRRGEFDSKIYFLDKEPVFVLDPYLSFRPVSLTCFRLPINAGLAMAALQPIVGGLPNPPRRSQSHPLPDMLPDPSIPDQSTSGLHKGSPAIAFPMQQVDSLSNTFTWTLTGKFAQG